MDEATEPPSDDDATTTAVPRKATRHPSITWAGRPSLRNGPANRAMRIGPTLTSITAVPASTWRSPAFKPTLYSPNHRTPNKRTQIRSLREMTGRDRGNATATRTTMPTKRRPIVIEPGEKVPARARIATNDEAHIVTVIIAAPNARDSVDNRIASLASFLRSTEARPVRRS